jgi:UDP-N-acetylmuramyl tripeptide synthase
LLDKESLNNDGFVSGFFNFNEETFPNFFKKFDNIELTERVLKLRLWIAIILAKSAYFLSRLRGYSGTTISGTVALRLDPHILKKIRKNIKTIIFVTGTNGKTTTANLLANMIRQRNHSVIHNKEGANMLSGVTSSLIKASNWMGTVNADTAVLEVDEGSLPKVLEQLTPTRIIVLNFFRDQLDRYGEIDVLIKSMMDAIRPVETELVLNADDPLVMQFASLEKRSVFFGVQNGALTFGNYAQGESVYCPCCGEEMVYQSVHYGQLGDYACSCGFSRKTPNYEVSSVQPSTNLCFQMADHQYMTTLKGNFNIYNVLAAISGF